MKLYQKKIIVPQIEEKIEKKIKNLNLSPETSPQCFIKKKGTKKHRYFSLCQDSNKKEILFYARIHNNPDAREKFITEINFLKEIKNQNLEIKKFIPEIKRWGIEKGFEWLEREKIKYPPLVNYSEKEINLIFKNNPKKISNLIFNISEIKPKNLNLKKFNWKDYLESNFSETLVEKKIITKNLSEKLKLLIKRNFNLLKKESNYVSHGDLTLENILSDKKNFWIIDWERTHLNNLSYDVGFLWTHLWFNKKTRTDLIKNYIKNLNLDSLKKFKKLLPITVSYLALGGIVLDIENENENNRKKRKNFCRQALNNSLKNFETLIKT